MVKRIDYETVKQKFESKGYTLISKEYQNNRQLLHFECPNHPDKENTIRLMDLNKGVGCKYCYNERRHLVKNFDFDYVFNFFKEAGYQLLETTYTNHRQKLKYRCRNHPDKVNEIRFRDFKRGVRCPHCKRDNFIEKITGEGNPTWNGGITSLNERLRREVKEWRRNILEKSNFTCCITGKRSNRLNVHHSLPFHEIRDQALETSGLPYKEHIKDYSEVEISIIVDKFNEIHKAVKGYPLIEDIHKEFHKKYGFGTTDEDFKEFKRTYAELNISK